MMDWLSIGTQAKNILESTFDGVAASTAVYTPMGSNTSYTLRCMVADEQARFKREGLRIDEIGALDRRTVRVVFKTADIIAAGLSKIEPTGTLVIDGRPMEFSDGEPFAQHDLSPMAGAINTFTHCWVRECVEAESTEVPISTGDPISFGGWN